MKKIDWVKVLNIANIAGFAWLLVRCMFNCWDLTPLFKHGGFYLFLSTWVIEFFVEHRWKFTFHREQILFALLVLFFLWGFLYMPFDGDKYFKRLTERRYPLLAFGIVGFFGVNKLYNKQMVFNVMTVVTASIIIYIVANVGLVRLVTTPGRVMLFADFCIEHVNAHMGFDLYLIFTLIGIWWLNFRSGEVPGWLRVWYSFVALLIVLTLCISDGRSGMGIGVIFICILLISAVWRYNRWLAIALPAVVLAVGIFAISHHGRMNKDYIRSEPRIAYWRAAGELISERPLLGYGISNAQERFDEVNMKYMLDSQREFFTNNQPGTKDCHNQFIQTTLEFGVVGLILLLGIYILPCILVRKEWRFLTCCIAGACFLQSLFDMFITGQFNIIFGLLMITSMLMENSGGIIFCKRGLFLKKKS